MKVEDIKNIAVLGAGVIGSSWALDFAWKGFPVNVWVRSISKKEKYLQVIKEDIESLMENGLIAADKEKIILDLIHFTDSIEEAVKDVQLIHETIAENLEMKQDFLKKIDEFAHKDAIFSSSTSSLRISDIVKYSKYSQRCINGHPFTPPHLLPVVEITYPEGDRGSLETAELASNFYRSIGKETTILKKDISGFIGNTLQDALLNKAVELLRNGICTVEDIDKTINFGPGLRWAGMGPFLVHQLGGGDKGLKGLWMHVGLSKIKDRGEEFIKNYELMVDSVQEEVNKEMRNRKKGNGQNNKELRKFRDKILINNLRMHGKL